MPKCHLSMILLRANTTWHMQVFLWLYEHWTPSHVCRMRSFLYSFHRLVGHRAGSTCTTSHQKNTKRSLGPFPANAAQKRCSLPQHAVLLRRCVSICTFVLVTQVSWVPGKPPTMWSSIFTRSARVESRDTLTHLLLPASSYSRSAPFRSDPAVFFVR